MSRNQYIYSDQLNLKMIALKNYLTKYPSNDLNKDPKGLPFNKGRFSKEQKEAAAKALLECLKDLPPEGDIDDNALNERLEKMQQVLWNEHREVLHQGCLGEALEALYSEKYYLDYVPYSDMPTDTTLKTYSGESPHKPTSWLDLEPSFAIRFSLLDPPKDLFLQYNIDRFVAKLMSYRHIIDMEKHKSPSLFGRFGFTKQQKESAVNALINACTEKNTVDDIIQACAVVLRNDSGALDNGRLGDIVGTLFSRPLDFDYAGNYIGNAIIAVVPEGYKCFSTPIRYTQTNDARRVLLPDSLKEISAHAFDDFNHLQKLHIPTAVTNCSVRHIHCRDLDEITCPQSINIDGFGGSNELNIKYYSATSPAEKEKKLKALNETKELLDQSFFPL
jgi:hypothetical protein